MNYPFAHGEGKDKDLPMPERVVRRILAPVELVDTSEPDLGYAIGLAAQLQAELRFFAVVDTPTTVALVARQLA